MLKEEEEHEKLSLKSDWKLRRVLSSENSRTGDLEGTSGAVPVVLVSSLHFTDEEIKVQKGWKSLIRSDSPNLGLQLHVLRPVPSFPHHRVTDPDSCRLHSWPRSVSHWFFTSLFYIYFIVPFFMWKSLELHSLYFLRKKKRKETSRIIFFLNYFYSNCRMRSKIIPFNSLAAAGSY